MKVVFTFLLAVFVTLVAALPTPQIIDIPEKRSPDYFDIGAHPHTPEQRSPDYFDIGAYPRV
ncbi:hypothetical protein BJ878DRAFT_540849 [Calycina marina]|uniref:Uncharacterized protein n=1 Tax=Calycina marina TaxID=1763456 RepID=A0A9P7Z5X6_9HELO|nr:hypothetical protein BJ878DRAFT_540849 [Calycina marina]